MLILYWMRESDVNRNIPINAKVAPEYFAACLIGKENFTNFLILINL